MAYGVGSRRWEIEEKEDLSYRVACLGGLLRFVFF